MTRPPHSPDLTLNFHHHNTKHCGFAHLNCPAANRRRYPASSSSYLSHFDLFDWCVRSLIVSGRAFCWFGSDRYWVTCRYGCTTGMRDAFLLVCLESTFYHLRRCFRALLVFKEGPDHAAIVSDQMLLTGSPYLCLLLSLYL